MQPFDIGDPHIEWEELNSAREEYEVEEELPTMEEIVMSDTNLENIQSKLKGEVTTLLVSQYDFTLDDAEEKINESFANDADVWNENAEAKDLANHLASDGDDE